VRESEQRFRGTFENAAVGITHVDAKGRWLRVNERFRQILGRPCEELQGRSFEDFTHSEDLEPDASRYAALWRGELDSYAVEKRYIRGDGQTAWTLVTRSLQRDEQGQPLYAICVVQNIGERKRAEEALRESELFYRQTLESIPGMVFTTRPDGYCDYQSQQWADYTGVPMGEQVGEGWNQLLHPDDRARTYAAWRDAVEGRAPYDLEYRVRRHDGQYEWFRVIGRPIRDGSGQIVRWFGVAANINDLKQTEQQLVELNASLEQRVAERTAEAEHRTAQLRELASELARAEQHERSRVASILHDHLQQLLVGAKFGTSVLRGQLGEESQRQALQKVDTLLDESLETSRNLTIELSPPILKKGTLAAALQWLVNWMHDKHGLHVHLKTDETLNPQDEGTRILLFESVRELLFNIVKHAGTDSACATLERHNGEHLRIIVADAGAGFDPGRHTSHDRSRGGFGLFSIRERLGLIGGRFEIESIPGEGTQMTLVAPLQLPPTEPVASALTDLLPVAQVEAALLQASTSPLATPGEPVRIRVLIADDHAVVRDGLARLLEMHTDVEVIGLATDGQHAVELAIHLRPDVILMDVSMPRLNGIDATRRVRSELPQVCVIGLSMHAEDEMAGRMREAGAIHYLAKTAPPDAVVAAIRKCVCKSSGRPEI
jgi:PAS domain S-box-containing protein